MRWFAAGHFVATWLVCSGLMLRFQGAGEGSVVFALFALVLWPLVMWLLPLKGYFHLKAITLDRLKARVSRGELKKVLVFGFGFATSLLAAVVIGATAWLVSAMDGFFQKQEGIMSLLHTLAWFPLALILWTVIPAFVLSRMAGRAEAMVGKDA